MYLIRKPQLVLAQLRPLTSLPSPAIGVRCYSVSIIFLCHICSVTFDLSEHHYRYSHSHTHPLTAHRAGPRSSLLTPLCQSGPICRVARQYGSFTSSAVAAAAAASSPAGSHTSACSAQCARWHAAEQ